MLFKEYRIRKNLLVMIFFQERDGMRWKQKLHKVEKDMDGVGGECFLNAIYR